MKNLIEITPLSKSVLSNLKIDSDTPKLSNFPHPQRAHYRAIVNWLTKYKPSLEASNLEKVKGYLETCHHLFELEAWESVSNLLSTGFNTFSNQGLGDQLGRWGYYREQIALYGELFGKLNHQIDAVCLKSLGIAYRWLTNFEEAQNYLNQALDLFQRLGDKEKSAETMHQLGVLQADNGKDLEALTHYNQAVVTFRELIPK